MVNAANFFSSLAALASVMVPTIFCFNTAWWLPLPRGPDVTLPPVFLGGDWGLSLCFGGSPSGHCRVPQSMSDTLEHQVKSKAFFKGNLRTYRYSYCDNIWTFILRDATFKNEDIETVLRKVKIVACDAKLLQSPRQ